jgi:O-antigen/teichoic acid export membrane protein
VKKNIIANIVGRFWSILSSFLFIPLYIRYLGFESYSVISFSLVVVAMMAVLDAGLTATLSREFSRLDISLSEKIKVFRTLETTYFIIIAFCVFIVFSLSNIIVENGLNLKSISTEKVSYYIKIISFDIGFQLLLRFYLGGMLGLEKQVKANIYQVAWGILRNGLVVVVIIYEPTLEMFFVWQTFATLFFTVLFRLSLNRELTGFYKFEFSLKIEKKVLKNIWRFAGGMLLISLVAALNTQMDKIAISKFLPVESLGYYTLAVSLSTSILVVVSPISIALLPRFTALFSDNNKKEAVLLFNKVTLFIAIIVFSIMANMSFFAKELIWVWTGDMQLSQRVFNFIPILAFTFAMLSLATIPYNIAIANGYTKLNNILGLVSLIITLPGYWFFTKKYGAIGAASLYCVVQTMITLIYIYFINKKFIGMSLFATYVKQMILPLLLTIAIAFCFSFMPKIFSSNRIFAIIWIGISTLLTFIIGSVLLFYKDKNILKSLYK